MKGVLYPKSDAHITSVLNRLGWQVKVLPGVHSADCQFEERHFLVEFEAMP
jgi:hypothetical protein